MKTLPVGSKLVTFRTTETRRGIKTLEVRKALPSIPSPRKTPTHSPSTFQQAYHRAFSPPSPIPGPKFKNVSSIGPQLYLLNSWFPSHKMIIFGNGFLSEVPTWIPSSLGKDRPRIIYFVKIVIRGKVVGGVWNVLEAECNAMSVAGKPMHISHSIG